MIVFRSYLRFLSEYYAPPILAAQPINAYLQTRLRSGVSVRTVAHDWACLRAICTHARVELDLQPSLRLTLRNLNKRANESPIQNARALLPDDLLAIVRRPVAGPSLQHRRDSALIVLAWSIAARPQDITQLRWEHIRDYGPSMEICIPAGKTAARTVPILPSRIPERCPVGLLRIWASCAGIDLAEADVRPVFFRIDRWGNYDRRNPITAESVGDIIRDASAAAGLGPGYSGNSCRSGFVTTAAENGVSDADIARITGHRTAAALQRYRRQVASTANPACKLL
jgi:integrase